MRSCATALAAATFAVLVSSPAKADEIFLCADRTMIRIDSASRAAQYENPCVKAWFADNKNVKTAAAGAAPATSKPVVATATSTPATATAPPPAAAGTEAPDDARTRQTRAGRRR